MTSAIFNHHRFHFKERTGTVIGSYYEGEGLVMRRMHLRFGHTARFMSMVFLALTIGLGVSDLISQRGEAHAGGSALPDMYPNEINPRNPCQCW